MKAIVNTRYGSPDVLRLEELEKPVPGEDEVVIQVHAAGLNAYDWHMLRADPFPTRFSEGLLRPKHTILGADIAGWVEAVGPGVTRFQPGDEVYGDIGWGGLAEYARGREKLLARKPANLSFVEAAAVPMAGMTALQALRDSGQLQPGQRVLVHGASGGVGTFAVQIARALGAEVTAVCSTAKMEQARSLGAEHVIDYTREDYSRSGTLYDVILVANGNRSPGDYERALAPAGRCVIVGGSVRQLFAAILLGRRKSKPGGKTLSTMMARISASDLEVLKEWIEAGQVRPIIDRTYPLDRAADALRYLIDGHAAGKVVVTITP